MKQVCYMIVWTGHHLVVGLLSHGAFGKLFIGKNVWRRGMMEHLSFEIFCLLVVGCWGFFVCLFWTALMPLAKPW